MKFQSVNKTADINHASGHCQSLGYRDGSEAKMNWIRIHWNDHNRRLTLQPDRKLKQRPGSPRVFAVEVVGSHAEPKQVEFRGAKVDVKLGPNA